MPQDVAESFREDGLLRSEGPHAPATVRPRLSSWATWHRWRGIEGSFAFPALPCAPRCGWRFRRRFVPVTGRGGARLRATCWNRLLATCASDRLADTRDVAILMVALRRADGGAARRRGCVSSSFAKSRPCASILPTRVRCLCRALRSSSAAPRRRLPMRRAGRFWSGRRSRRCGNGFSAPTSRRGRCSGRSTGGRGRGPGADASVDQPHR